MTKRSEYVKGLRALADLLEANEDVKLPFNCGVAASSRAVTFYRLGHDDSKDAAAAFARAFPGKLDKRVDDTSFRLVGKLHGLHLEFVTYRSDVCTRVVKGSSEVTVTVPDPNVTVPLVEVTRVVEDVEWVCDPILTGATS